MQSWTQAVDLHVIGTQWILDFLFIYSFFWMFISTALYTIIFARDETRGITLSIRRWCQPDVMCGQCELKQWLRTSGLEAAARGMRRRSAAILAGSARLRWRDCLGPRPECNLVGLGECLRRGADESYRESAVWAQRQADGRELRRTGGCFETTWCAGFNTSKIHGIHFACPFDRKQLTLHQAPSSFERLRTADSDTV